MWEKLLRVSKVTDVTSVWKMIFCLFSPHLYSTTVQNRTLFFINIKIFQDCFPWNPVRNESSEKMFEVIFMALRKYTYHLWQVCIIEEDSLSLHQCNMRWLSVEESKLTECSSLLLIAQIFPLHNYGLKCLIGTKLHTRDSYFTYIEPSLLLDINIQLCCATI